jgi:hypothetical protein
MSKWKKGLLKSFDTTSHIPFIKIPVEYRSALLGR